MTGCDDAVAVVRLIAEWFSRANGNFRRAESSALHYYYKGDDARGGMKYLGNLRRTQLLRGANAREISPIGKCELFQSMRPDTTERRS